MIVTEIFRETKQRTQIKSRKNGKRIIIIGSIVTVLLTSLFYSVGIPQHDHLYSQIPLIATIPLVLLTSFNAIGMITIMIFFLWALGESTHSQVKNSLEQRYEKRINQEATALRHQFEQYGQRDYDIQIEEAKAGLRYEFDNKLKNVKAEYDKKLEDIVRAYRIKTLAWEKERNLGKQAIRERDYERQLNKKLTRLVVTLSKIIIDLKTVIKKLKGE